MTDERVDGDPHIFWSDLLAGAETTRLPTARPAPGAATATLDTAIPGELVASLRRHAASLAVTLRSVQLTAHVTVLSYIAGTADVLTGYQDAGWAYPVPFRMQLAECDTWADLALTIFGTQNAIGPYAGYPRAGIERAAGSRTHLFETAFSSAAEVPAEVVFAAGFATTAAGARLRMRYDPAALTADQVARFGGYYRRALERIAADPTVRCHPLDLMDEAERRMVRGFSGQRVAVGDEVFPDRFRQQARRTPDRIALVCGSQRLTYAGLDEESDRVAASLARRGVRAGDVVVTLLPRGIPWAVAVLALLKLGAVYLPQDLAYPSERIRAVLRRSGSRCVVTERATARQVAAAVPGDVDILEYEEASAGPLSDAPLPSPARGAPAYIIFTSGSTGEPKGAVIAHSGMLNHLVAKRIDLGLGLDDRVAQVATQCFDISIWQLLVAWLDGGCTAIYTRFDLLDVPGFLRALAADRITVLEVVPSYLDLLLSETDRRPVELPELRLNLVTGEPLAPALTQRWFARYPAIPLVNAYGPTEASDDVTHHHLTQPVSAGRVPVGRPIINTGIHVVDGGDTLRPLGSYGEICVTGDGVGLGYVNDPDRTAKAFQRNRLDDRSPMLYRTGDIGRWLPGGVLDCAGRGDDQVKVRGYRIELSDVDAALARLPGVDAAVTVASELGGMLRLVAYYVGAAEPDLAQFQRGLSELLPAYMHPEQVVRVDEFPLNATGKIDRKALNGRR